MMVVLAGRTGSGKSTLAELAARRGGDRYASFGQYVRQLAQERSVDWSDRQILQDLGQTLVEEDPRRFVAAFLEYCGHHPSATIFIDGLRHESIWLELTAIAEGR